jgi:hypothetical protein
MLRALLRSLGRGRESACDLARRVQLELTERARDRLDGCPKVLDGFAFIVGSNEWRWVAVVEIEPRLVGSGGEW